MPSLPRHILDPRSLVLTIGGLLISGPAVAKAEPPVSEEAPLRRISGPGQTAPGSVGSPVVSDYDPLEVRRIDLHAVEQSISDRGPLDASLRWVPSGLQLPTGYDQVYRRDGGGFWRADGGLVAAFNQSVYIPTRGGLAVEIPASTVFVIGGVPMGAEPGHGRLLAADPMNPGSVPSIFPATMVPDEHHRIQAIPGDRMARFGFGPGHRISSEVRPSLKDEVQATGDAGESRFRADEDYRGDRVDRLLALWRRGRINPDPVLRNSEGATGREADPSLRPAEEGTLRPGS